MRRRARETALLELIGEIYRAAGEPAHWPAVLAGFSRVIECAGAILYAVDRRDQSVPFIISYDVPDIMEREYREHYLAIDPRPPCALAHLNRTVYDYLHSTEPEIDRSEYYDWHRRRGGFRYCIGAALAEATDPPTFIVVGLQRTARQGHVDEQEIALFDRLLPHLRQAVLLSTRFAELRGRADALTETLHDAGPAMILLDRRGRLIFATAAAERIMSAADGLVVDREDRLRASRASEDAALQHLITAVRQDDVTAPRAAGGEVAVPRISGLPPFVVSVRRLRPPEDLMIAHRPVVTAVTIRDPSAATQPETRSLELVFGLTPAEASVAGALAAGSDVKTYARESGIAYETARWHLKSVFAKTETSKQAELVRLVLKTTPPDQF